MPINTSVGRQYPLVAEVEVSFADLVSGVGQDAIKLPSGAVVHRGRVRTDAAFNSATSDTISVGDAASATRFINANTTVLRTIDTVQEFAAASAGQKYASGGVVRAVWTGVGAVPTTGKFRLYVEYSIDGKAQEVQT